MSKCCPSGKEAQSSIPKYPLKYKCSSNGQNCSLVTYSTVLHHVKTPWQQNIEDQAYYFCDDPECDVVYFGVDDSLITKSMMRTIVGVKEKSDDALICYCFDVSKAIAKSDNSAYEFVLEQTKKSNCSCATTNPSGRCCLKDFIKT